MTNAAIEARANREMDPASASEGLAAQKIGQVRGKAVHAGPPHSHSDNDQIAQLQDEGAMSTVAMTVAAYREQRRRAARRHDVADVEPEPLRRAAAVGNEKLVGLMPGPFASPREAPEHHDADHGSRPGPASTRSGLTPRNVRSGSGYGEE